MVFHFLFSVVCHQLGYGNAVKAYKNAYGHFGSANSSMPIWLNNVQCEIYDRYLFECVHSGWGDHDCLHYEDVGVACNSTSMPN